MGGTIENVEPITLCSVLNGLRQQRVKTLAIAYESHLGERVEIAINRSKGDVYRDAGGIGGCGGGGHALDLSDHEPHGNS